MLVARFQGEGTAALADLRRPATIRRALIVREVDEAGEAVVGRLAARFRVSQVTIRKDLGILDAQHRLHRTRGGAVSIRRPRVEREFEVRQRQQRWQKQAIGRVAARLVEDGQVIALDASTTALQVAQALRRRGGWQHLVVVTNGLRTAQELAHVHGIDVRLPAGPIRGEALSISGMTADELERCWPARIDLALFGAVGLTVETGLAELTEEEAAVKRIAVSRSARVVGIVDHTKWGRVAPAAFCPTIGLSRLVTDSGAAASLFGSLAACGVPVTLAHFRADA